MSAEPPVLRSRATSIAIATVTAAVTAASLLLAWPANAGPPPAATAQTPVAAESDAHPGENTDQPIKLDPTAPRLTGTPDWAGPPEASDPSGGDPLGLRPGTNHSWQASSYAYPAEDVYRWMVEGPQAEDYPSQRLAFLTFDDGPDLSGTGQTLQALEDLDVPATFFVLTSGLDAAELDSGDPEAGEGSREALLLEEISAGHSICPHSHSHNYQRLYPGGRGNPAAVGADVDTAIERVRDIVGEDYTPTCYRYPGGRMSWQGMEGTDAALAERGLTPLDWNCMTGDAEPASRAPRDTAGAVRMLREALPEDDSPHVAVVLMHDAARDAMSAKALPHVVAELRERGYEFGVIS